MSWVGFYTNLGFDVCLFNYRGYVASTGAPTPARVKADAEVVLQQLRLTRGVTRLLIHGESIGGMVASHLGANFRADFLVCDRTFASLDSLAARMMGWWAAMGLRLIGQWHTDVVTDFLAANCPKVVLQVGWCVCVCVCVCF